MKFSCKRFLEPHLWFTSWTDSTLSLWPRLSRAGEKQGTALGAAKKRPDVVVGREHTSTLKKISQREIWTQYLDLCHCQKPYVVSQKRPRDL